MNDFEFDPFESYAKIVVIGVGGAGSNAVNKMLEDKSESISYWVFNTDAQALSTSPCEHRLVLGKNTTRGLGAGGNPSVGKEAALDSIDDIKEIVSGANMVFIAAGMGGGTGTGAAPIVAKVAREAGALTLAIVTRPFDFEGQSRKVKAIEGINDLKQNADSIIIISNNSLMNSNGDRPFSDAFSESDRVLGQCVKTITDLIILPGIINLDFADIKNTLANKGMAMIGFGMGEGEKKSIEAATNAFSSPLLEASIRGAHTAIINISGGPGVTLNDASEAVEYIREAAGNNINIIFGVQQNPQLKDSMLVSVIATDFDAEYDETKPSLVTTRSQLDNSKAVEKKTNTPVINPHVDDEKNILPDFLENLRKKQNSQQNNISSAEDKEESDSEEESVETDIEHL